MIKDNIKIVVNEVQKINPRGSAASSDIVYIPGFAKEGRKNVPTLCQTVEELMDAFAPSSDGDVSKAPYVITDKDIAGCDRDLGLIEGDLDKSFLMAVELLNSGLSVVYENVSPEDVTGGSTLVATASTDEVDRMNSISGGYQYTSCIEKQSETFDFKFMLDPSKFEISGGLVTGVASVGINILEENENISVSLGTISCASTTGVKITGSKIELTGAHEHALKYLVFTAKVNLTLTETKEGEVVKFSVKVVEGDDASAPAVETSRLKYLYDNLSSRFEELADKGEYSVKYITSGGYPTYFLNDHSLALSQLDAAYKRGDAVAIIDHEYDPSRSLKYNASDSIYSDVNKTFKSETEKGTYGAMFTPYAKYSLTRMGMSDVVLPASFGYLKSLATAIKTSPNWLAIAGVTRGLTSGYTPIETDPIVTNVIAEDYQPKYGDQENNMVAINAITNIKPYGQCIWGNRTLAPMPGNASAEPKNFLNTRNMISDIKKLAYTTAKQLMFEQNSDTLWLKFKAGVSPLLEQLRSGNGISDYKLIKGTTRFNGSQLARNEIAAVIRICPLHAVEYFEITVLVTEDDVAVE